MIGWCYHLSSNCVPCFYFYSSLHAPHNSVVIPLEPDLVTHLQLVKESSLLPSKPDKIWPGRNLSIKGGPGSPSAGLNVYTRKCVYVTGLSGNISVWMPCQSGCVYVSDSPLISSFLRSLFEDFMCCVTLYLAFQEISGKGSWRSTVISKYSCKSNIPEMSVSQEIYWLLICTGCSWWAQTAEQLSEETLVMHGLFPPRPRLWVPCKINSFARLLD